MDKINLNNYDIANFDLINYFGIEHKYCETSIKEFNKGLGGLASGQYYVFAAPTNAGKSTLLKSLMIDCLHRGKKCGYISSEDNQNETAGRLLLALSNINVNKFLKNELTEANKEYMMKIRDKYKGKLYIYHRTSLNDNISNIIKAWIEAGVEYVFYDYIGSIADPMNNKEHSSLTAESDELQALCSDNNICVVAACQLNRSFYTAGSDSLNPSCLAGATALANKAKVLTFLYDEIIDDKKHKMMYIYKGKNWLSELPSYKFEVIMDPQRLQVRSVDTFEMNKF